MIEIDIENSLDINLDLDDILSKVSIDIINEIKRLIDSGKNVNNENLAPKVNGSTPTFHNTGLMLDSISYEITNEGINIFIDNSSRAKISEYLKQHDSTWNIIDTTKYIMEFADSRLQFYLDNEFK